MQLSPLDSAIPSWGSPTLQGFDTNVNPGERLRGSSRQFVRFYNHKEAEVYTIKAKINHKTGASVPVEVGTRQVTREMVEIITPGDKNIINDRAQDFHRREHWAQYKAFRDGRVAPIGLPIDEATFIAPNVATELKYYNCHTVEQLADASDKLCEIIPNGWELREFARAHAKAKKGNETSEEVNSLKIELADAMQKIAALTDAMRAKQIIAPTGEPVSSEKTVLPTEMPLERPSGDF